MLDRILYGECGIAGCLDCRPLSIVFTDEDTDESWEEEVSEISFTHSRKHWEED